MVKDAYLPSLILWIRIFGRTVFYQHFSFFFCVCRNYNHLIPKKKIKMIFNYTNIIYLFKVMSKIPYIKQKIMNAGTRFTRVCEFRPLIFI